jgi:hypothetical protein
MSSASETCSCGAKIELTGRGSDASAERALTSWRTEHRHPEPKADTAPEPLKGERPEHLPSGNNFASTERNYDSAPHELNAERKLYHSPDGPYGRSISLKWTPNE